MPARDFIILALGVAVVHGPDLWRLASRRGETRQSGAAPATPQAHNVILVVADGLRWQDVFRGADSLLVFGNPKTVGGNVATVRQRYWRLTPGERRQALMPFLWNTVARQGQIFGNRDVGSHARVTNGMRFSYPGYNEMLVGYPDPRIDRNEYGPNPNVTVFEWLNRRGDFRGRVGAIGSWETFRDIFNERRSGLYVRDSESDVLSHVMARGYLRRHGPRALFVAFGQTDDFAHEGRYDLTLDAAHAVDRYLADLWSTAQSMPQYRGRTTLIVVPDHGRGRTSRDWMDHGARVEGAEEIWFAIIGPGVPALGERRNVGEVTLAQTAATVAAALGLDYRREVARAAPRIDVVPSPTERRAIR